jgi:uncharacterized membrane protein
MANIEFKVGVIRPVECVKEGWELIKDQYWLIFAITLVGMLIASVVPLGILFGPMLCGIFYCLLQKMNRQPTVFEGLFKGFDYFLPSFIATLFLLIPAFIIGIIAYIPLIMMQFSMMNTRNPNPNDILVYFVAFSVLMIIFGLFIGTIHALLMFAYPLIVEHKLSGVEAAKLSSRAVIKNLGGIGGLIAVHIGLMFVGYLLCFVGVYLVLPIILASVVVAYRKVFSPPTNSNFNPPPPSAFQGAGSYNQRI